jgi:S-ribosylhomocysteine lyase
MDKIPSFTVDHLILLPGIYISRVDGDITTYDMRTRRPNYDPLMDAATIHSFEHLFATFVRFFTPLKNSVIFFGPMGCQTGFYLLVRNACHQQVLDAVRLTLEKIIAYDGPVPGNSPVECGNYSNLSLAAAQKEAAAYLEVLTSWQPEHLTYPTAPATE